MDLKTGRAGRRAVALIDTASYIGPDRGRNSPVGGWASPRDRPTDSVDKSIDATDLNGKLCSRLPAAPRVFCIFSHSKHLCDVVGSRSPLHSRAMPRDHDISETNELDDITEASADFYPESREQGRRGNGACLRFT